MTAPLALGFFYDIEGEYFTAVLLLAGVSALAAPAALLLQPRREAPLPAVAG